MARNTDEVQAGPGLLYAAPAGTAEPTSASSSLNPAFREVGYTEEGPTFTFSFTSDKLEVAEETLPIRYMTTEQEATIKFDIAQISIENFALALNLGADFAHSATYLEPPDPGSEVRIMLIHKTQQGALWLFRQCINSSSIEMARKKAPDKALIPVEFKMEKPANAKSFRVYPNAQGLI